MTTQDQRNRSRRGSRLRAAGWGFAAFLLLLPFVAMQVSDAVRWGAGDFVLFGAMLLIAGGVAELISRRSANGFYRAGASVAVAAGFLLVWVNLAVGFLGSEDNPANLMFAGVIAVAIGGAFLSHFRPAGMVKAMIAAALAQALVGVVGLGAGLASPGAAGTYEVIMGTTLFGGLWLIAAGLFGEAARRSA
jgi:hypothetical protein